MACMVMAAVERGGKQEEALDRGGVICLKPDSLISPDGNPRCMMSSVMEISGSLKILPGFTEP